MKKIIILLILAMFCFSCGNSKNNKRTESKTVLTQYSGKVENLSDFESSPFYSKYRVKKEDGWKLQDGGFNNTYYLSSTPDTDLAVQTLKDKVSGAGIIFYKKEILSDKDFELVFDFIENLDNQTQLQQTTKDFIKANIKKSVSQIKQSTPTSHSRFKIFSGKVGNEETVSIEAN